MFSNRFSSPVFLETKEYGFSRAEGDNAEACWKLVYEHTLHWLTRCMFASFRLVFDLNIIRRKTLYNIKGKQESIVVEHDLQLIAPHTPCMQASR